jgi:hypothetical protein
MCHKVDQATKNNLRFKLLTVVIRHWWSHGLRHRVVSHEYEGSRFCRNFSYHLQDHTASQIIDKAECDGMVMKHEIGDGKYVQSLVSKTLEGIFSLGISRRML